MTEHDADDNELAEAQALAEALEGRGAEPPDEALQTAALLRYSGDDGELAPERADAILSELDAVPLPKPAPRQRGWLVWLPLGVGAAAAVAVTLFLAQPAAKAPVVLEAAPAPASLPAPDAKLLAAQAAAADGKDDERLQTEMKAYRERMLRALEAAYPQMIGALDIDTARSR